MSDGYLALSVCVIQSDWLKNDGTLLNTPSFGFNEFQTDGIQTHQESVLQLQQMDAELQELELVRPRAQFAYPYNTGHVQLGDGIFTQEIESANLIVGNFKNTEPYLNKGNPDWGFYGWFAFGSRGCTGKLRKIQFGESYFESEFLADSCYLWLTPDAVADVWLNYYYATRTWTNVSGNFYGYT